jgi:hypothetical protein
MDFANYNTIFVSGGPVQGLRDKFFPRAFKLLPERDRGTGNLPEWNRKSLLRHICGTNWVKKFER